MRTLTVLVTVLFAAGLVLAGEAKAPEKAGKTHEATVEVVSVDVKAKTITMKDEKGEPKTAPVLGKAVEKLATVKAGDKVTVTCQDNDKGEHQGVTDIVPAKTAA